MLSLPNILYEMITFSNTALTSFLQLNLDMIPIFLRNNQNPTTFVLDPARNCCKGVGCG